MRTDGGKGTYEWWYFDAYLNDGSKLVITFSTKPITDGRHTAPSSVQAYGSEEGLVL